MWLINCLIESKHALDKTLQVGSIESIGKRNACAVISVRCAFNAYSEEAVIHMETDDVEMSVLSRYFETSGARSVKIESLSSAESLKSVMDWCVKDGFVLLSFDDKSKKRSLDDNEEGESQSKTPKIAAIAALDGESQQLQNTAAEVAVEIKEIMVSNKLELVSAIQALPSILDESITRSLQAQVGDLSSVMVRSTQACMDQLDNLKEQVRELKAEKDILRNQLSVQLQECIEVNERQRFQISQLHKQRDKLIEQNTALLEEKARLVVDADSAAKIASLETINKNQRAALNMVNIKKEEVAISLARSEASNRDLVEETDTMRKKLAELLGAGK